MDSWNFVATLYAGDPHPNDQFGYSVDIQYAADTNDYRVIVGARYHDDDYETNSETNEGAAYIYIGSGMNWPQEDMITFSDLVDSNQLGFSAAIYKEFAIAGAPYMDNVVGLFQDRPGKWEGTKLISGDVIQSDYFGYSLDIADTFLVIGAKQKDANKGALFISSMEKYGHNIKYSHLLMVMMTMNILML
jgi:hypothetical protein